MSLVVTQQDPSAKLQEGITRLTKLYEENAYLVYNLALRVTADPDAAARACERTFLRVADGREAPQLARWTVEFALEEAPDAPSLVGAGAEGAQELLHASARLSPPQRAALAMATLASSTPEEIGRALSLNPATAEEFHRRALADFAAQLDNCSSTEAGERYGAWLMAEPPEQLWEKIYLEAYPVLQDRAKGGTSPPAAVSAGRPAAQSASRREQILARMPRLPLRAVAVLIALLAVAGVAFSQLMNDGKAKNEPADPFGAGYGTAAPAPKAGSTDNEGGSAYSGKAKRKPLTPAELDELRREELEDLERYGKQEKDKQLAEGKRLLASRKREALEQRARERREQRAQQQAEARARRQQAREQARLRREAAAQRRRDRIQRRRAAQEPATREQIVPAEPETEVQEPQSPTAPPKEQVEKNCLYNPDTGSYICPR